MTDYIYSLSLASQTKGFLFSLGFGFLMGAVYDIFRIVRIGISRGKKLQIVLDILYCILLAFLTFIFFITINEGEIRIYLLLGEAVGFMAYGLSLGVIVIAFAETFIGWIKAGFKLIFKPIRKLLWKIKQFLNKGNKRNKKLKNKWKILLKPNKHLLYNLFVKKGNPVNKNLDEKEV
ncbi:MAG: spore cortex biosynthesis protein YabQ [Clostridia bacterium]|nr:spore cortex biosynthesis protein YabQ [Clostridia bacterium]